MTTLTKENDLYFVTVEKIRMFGRVDGRNFKVDFNQRHARLHVDMTRCAKLVTSKDVKSVISHMFSSISYITPNTQFITQMSQVISRKSKLPSMSSIGETKYKIRYYSNPLLMLTTNAWTYHHIFSSRRQ